MIHTQFSKLIKGVLSWKCYGIQGLYVSLVISSTRHSTSIFVLTLLHNKMVMLSASNAPMPHSSYYLQSPYLCKMSWMFWRKATLLVVHTINRHPTPLLQDKFLHGISPTYNILKLWGCIRFVLLRSHEHTKLKPPSYLCCFLGYGI